MLLSIGTLKELAISLTIFHLLILSLIKRIGYLWSYDIRIIVITLPTSVSTILWLRLSLIILLYNSVTRYNLEPFLLFPVVILRLLIALSHCTIILGISAISGLIWLIRRCHLLVWCRSVLHVPIGIFILREILHYIY